MDARAEFQAKLKDAEEAQEFKEDVTTPVEAKIVKEAPGATLANGDGDVATTVNCAGDIDAFCDGIKPGESRLADCLTQQMTEEEKGNVDGKKLTDACKQELADFRIDAASNINKDIPLATACKKDAEKLCADVDSKEPSAVLACLRELKQRLSQACQDEVFQAQLEAAKDYRADAELADACEPDAEQLCVDVKPGEGRVQDCLRDKRPQLSWECQEELFRQEVENADDTRLSIRLMNKCMADKKAFCADVKPGGAKIKDCLEEHREDPQFSAECKAELEAMMERRAADFRLDAALRELCRKDIEDVCGYEKESMDSIEGFDARVIQCLQDYRDELVEPECKAQVHKLTQRAAQDIRFDEPLADACFEDRAKLCDGVQPGSARVIRCLQDQREELSYECRATLFDQEVRMAEDIDFKYPMKRACSAEIQKLCVGIPHGHARVIRCLQDFLDDSEMSAECKEEVQRDMIRSNEDYRLNYRLNKACQTDIEQLCSDECSPFLGQACGGRVLRCLTDKQDAIQSVECQNEVFYFEKMEVNDFRNDVLLAEACREDVDKFCKDTEPGEGRVHECLRAQREALSEACRKEELKLNIIQSRDIRLRPKLNKLCSEEIAVYCKEVKPGKGRVFKCLQENLAKPDFGQQCKEQVEQREARMQEDYRLDYGVSSACKADVDQRCAAEKGKAHGNAEVLKCLVNNFSSISEGCQREMSRAVRMALWEYKKGGALTGMCDADVGSICGKATKNPKNRGIWSIGAVGRCLSRQLAEDKPLEPACRTLVAVAAPKDALAMFDSSMTASAIAQKVADIQKAASISAQLVNPQARGASVITLTGWVALAAVAALMVVIVGSIVFAYRRYTGMDRPYTIVTKQGDV
ncbi:hypothetical protein WJX72_010380 [[Myrmecia] bisecta]|uniref:Golgi apparatus protein 1 n=1 Tax=[Myrmecia] bisecta TaxID=41462 RepID=A0AAW1QG70_9CHLO